MTISIDTITIESRQPDVLAEFWTALLGYRRVDHPTDSLRLDDPSGAGPTLLLQPGTDKPPGRKNRFHLDLRPTDQAAAVELALGLGAVHCDVGQTGEESWIVMADAEGNEFCILQSVAARRSDDDLPFVDEHGTSVAASAETVWQVLLDHLDRQFSRVSSTAYTRVAGCADVAASGPRPLDEGSTVPGFRVVSIVPLTEIALEGRHRFSTYRLTFRVDQHGASESRLRAETRASFPGFAGECYRRVVIASGGHAILVGRLLSGVRRKSELAADRVVP
jgi:catechol 2,3-dioxygenase-like lactoylglutathione lyase family enzyme